ncbi:multicopper oxidase domain-containing protein [Candidatus Bathyarchaeota archaeon]|nr:multicopper oxidase domain-containing protein [Candidatus Bathyarchaeota archaeon]
MHPLSLFSGLALGLGLPVLGAPSNQPALDKRQDCESDFDSATNPKCWKDGFDIDTNWYEDVPDTGNINEYWFDVVEKNVSIAGGPERLVMSVNGSVPGPTIFADWGDTISEKPEPTTKVSVS